MKVYKCDGKRFSDGVCCPSETSDENKDGNPEHWITIEGKIANDSRIAHCIIANGVRHFCSMECLKQFLFKDK